MTTDLQAIDLPFDEAIAFFRQKANVKTARWTDVWKEAHSRSFMVAGAATDALVDDFRAAIDKAISQGTTLEEFRKDFDHIVQKHGWEYNGAPGWRSRVIYETNLAGAYSAGRYTQMSDPDVKKAYPYWQYVHGDSRRPRPQHLAWNGLVLRCDDGFWDSHYPPNGWRCSCYVRPVSGPGLARMGKDGPDEAPKIETREWVDKKSGRREQVPVGIDPGFDYNPGKAWVKAPVKSDPMRPLPAPRDLQAFLEKPRGTVPVGTLNSDVMKMLDTKASTVQLSADTLSKQRREHKDLRDPDYGVLYPLLENPDVVLQDNRPGKVLLLLRSFGRVFVASVKVTADKKELFVNSLYTARARSIRQLLKRLALLKGDADKLFK